MRNFGILYQGYFFIFSYFMLFHRKFTFTAFTFFILSVRRLLTIFMSKYINKFVFFSGKPIYHSIQYVQCKLVSLIIVYFMRFLTCSHKCTRDVQLCPSYAPTVYFNTTFALAICFVSIYSNHMTISFCCLCIPQDHSHIR